MPGHRRAPVVPGDERPLLPERVHQRDHVAGQVQDRVLVGGLRAAGAAVAALVGRDGVKACLGQRGELMPPRVPALGEPVQQHDQRALARLGHVHAQPARVHITVPHSGQIVAGPVIFGQVVARLAVPRLAVLVQRHVRRITAW